MVVAILDFSKLLEKKSSAYGVIHKYPTHPPSPLGLPMGAFPSSPPKAMFKNQLLLT